MSNLRLFKKVGDKVWKHFEMMPGFELKVTVVWSPAKNEVHLKKSSKEGTRSLNRSRLEKDWLRQILVRIAVFQCLVKVVVEMIAIRMIRGVIDCWKKFRWSNRRRGFQWSRWFASKRFGSLVLHALNLVFHSLNHLFDWLASNVVLGDRTTRSLSHGRMSGQPVVSVFAIVIKSCLWFPRRRSSSGWRVRSTRQSWSSCRDKNVWIQERESLWCLLLLRCKVRSDSCSSSSSRKSCIAIEVVVVVVNKGSSCSRLRLLLLRFRSDSQVIHLGLYDWIHFLQDIVIVSITYDRVDVITCFDVWGVFGFNLPFYLEIERKSNELFVSQVFRFEKKQHLLWSLTKNIPCLKKWKGNNFSKESDGKEFLGSKREHSGEDMNWETGKV